MAPLSRRPVREYDGKDSPEWPGEIVVSLVLDLPPELESELAAEAAQLRLSLSEYVLRLLSEGRVPASRPRNGADLVEYWQTAGLVSTRPDIVDAPAHARDLRQQRERRERP